MSNYTKEELEQLEKDVIALNTPDKLCPICGSPVKHVSDGGEGIVMFVDSYNSKGDSLGIRPLRAEDGSIQDIIHLECANNKPNGAHFPCWL